MGQEKMKYLESLVGKTPMLELIFDYKGEKMDLIDRIFEKYGVKKVATMLIIISSISLIIIAVLIFKTISDSNEFQKQERIRQQNIQETEIPAFEDFNKKLNERFRRSC